MLVAHLVPGYLAAAAVKPAPHWTRDQRRVMWAVALGSTVFPDFDVIYNTLLRGFVNHSLLWTHSVFVWAGLGVLWGLLRGADRWPYSRMLFGLIAVGGLSHLGLDMIAHNTPLFYPLSNRMIGIAPARVVEGGLGAYLTDPVFLLEPLLLLGALAHWWRAQSIRNISHGK